MMSLSKTVSYRHTPQKTEITFCTVKEKLRDHAENTPNRNACVVYDTNNLDSRSSITCLELYNQACSFARGLRKLGLRQGDIVGLEIPNGPTAMVCIFGTQLAGCIPLIFLFHRQSGNDIIEALKNRGNCTAVVIDPGQEDGNWKICSTFLQEVSPGGTAKSEQIPSLRYFMSTKPIKGHKNVLLTQDILKSGNENKEIDLPDLDPDDVAAILLTSGSTGTPKPVQYTYINLFDFASHLLDRCGLTESDVYLNANLFNWIAGFPHVFLFSGITRVTSTNLLAYKSLTAINEFIMRAVEREKCTFALFSVPCLLEFAKQPKEEHKWAASLKTIFTGGLPIPASCASILKVLCVNYYVFYGATEIGLVTAIQIHNGEDVEDYITGSPLPGIEIKVVDDNGKVIPRNQTGEIYIRHCGQHLGYHNDRIKTEKVFLPSRWFKTDDVGYMNDEGNLIINGRKSDVIIVGGELVSPSYLESVIMKHPGVQEVVVTAIPDETFFQQACACIISRPGYTLTETTMDEFFRQEFTVVPACRGLTPKYYLFFDTLPTSALGKTSRRLTQEIALQKLQRKQ